METSSDFQVEASPQIGLFSRILAALLGRSWEALPSLLIYLSLTLPVKLGTEMPKQSRRSLRRLGGGGWRREARVAGVKVELHCVNLSRRPPPFLAIFVKLFEAARSSATTPGFTVAHRRGCLHVAKVTVPMQLEGTLKEDLCSMNYCINV